MQARACVCACMSMCCVLCGYIHNVMYVFFVVTMYSGVRCPDHIVTTWRVVTIVHESRSLPHTAEILTPLVQSRGTSMATGLGPPQIW